MAEAEFTPFRSEPDAAPLRLVVRRVRPTPGSQLALIGNGRAVFPQNSLRLLEL